jgi:hypothetical protein
MNHENCPMLRLKAMIVRFIRTRRAIRPHC